VSFWLQFKEEFLRIITDGGLLMGPLTLLAIAIYWTAFHMLFYFAAHPLHKYSRADLLCCFVDPSQLKGELKDIFDFTHSDVGDSVLTIRQRFEEVRHAYLAEIDGRRAFLMTLITTAPLTGLLGTVMGMLTTFGGLAVNTGGKTVDQIAAGISEALITTQTGLIIAIPGYVIASMIFKKRTRMEACLTVMETMSVQFLEKNSKDRTAVA
jgi:biopolymer transport protein ExbB